MISAHAASAPIVRNQTGHFEQFAVAVDIAGTKIDISSSLRFAFFPLLCTTLRLEDFLAAQAVDFQSLDFENILPIGQGASRCESGRRGFELIRWRRWGRYDWRRGSLRQL